MTTCLLVDEDDELRALTGQRLASYGMTIRMACTVQSCREIRRDMKVPVIMLTASSDPVSRILGLEMGADDYLLKPFEPRELLARIRAVMRRTTGALSMDPLRI